MKFFQNSMYSMEGDEEYYLYILLDGSIKYIKNLQKASIQIKG